MFNTTSEINTVSIQPPQQDGHLLLNTILH